MINFVNIFITPPKTFQFDLGDAGKEILTLSALYRSCQFLPLSDRTNRGDLILPGCSLYTGGMDDICQEVGNVLVADRYRHLNSEYDDS